MSPKRKRLSTKPGPNPDPERYILVRTKERWYWRLKRGLGGPAPLNDSFRRNADTTSACNRAAKRIVDRLKATTGGLKTGRIGVRFSGRLKKALNRLGRMDYHFFEGYDLQDAYPMNKLLNAPCRVAARQEGVELSIRIAKHTLKRKSALVSHYYFEAVLVWGDPGVEGGLRVDSVTSALYPIGAEEQDLCLLSLDLPQRGVPWMVLLKVSCLEGDELAVHPRHYGMRVIKVG